MEDNRDIELEKMAKLVFKYEIGDTAEEKAIKYGFQQSWIMGWKAKEAIDLNPFKNPDAAKRFEELNKPKQEAIDPETKNVFNYGYNEQEQTELYLENQELKKRLQATEGDAVEQWISVEEDELWDEAVKAIVEHFPDVKELKEQFTIKKKVNMNMDIPEEDKPFLEAFKKAIEPDKSIQGDAVEFAHKIGVAILKHSFEVIDTSLRKSVVEVGKIVMEFDKEGIDIITHPEF